MDTQNLLRLRLQLLAEAVCNRIGNAEILSIDNTADNNVRRDRHMLYVLFNGQNITVPIGNEFLEYSGDETVINYLTTAIENGF
jgi:hypothetical protein